MPGTTSKRDALLVQEQRFLAAAVEHERVAPLQAHDRLALAGLLGHEQADRVLRRPGRGRVADVDALGIGASHPQQARIDERVVDDDVRAGQVTEPAHRDQ